MNSVSISVNRLIHKRLEFSFILNILIHTNGNTAYGCERLITPPTRVSVGVSRITQKNVPFTKEPVPEFLLVCTGPLVFPQF
jgi:hypothetical protein